MNAFPDTILTPQTSDRLRITPQNESIIQQLLELEVDVASFFMPEDEIPDGNKPSVARDDLIDQLSPEVRAKVFPSLTPVVAPTPPVKPAESEDDDDDGGMSAGMGMSLGKKEENRKRPQPEEGQEVEGSDMEM